MNTNSPLIPQGSLIDQKPRNKSNVYIAVFGIIGLHVMVLSALLLQGCKDHPSTVAGNAETNNLGNMPLLPPPPTNLVDTMTPTIPATAPLAGTVPMPPSLATPLTPPTTVTLDSMSVPAASTVEHSVAKKDTFSTIAKKYGVSVAAIEKANPNVDSKKLKIGQKIVIPEHAASTTAGSSVTPATATALAPASGVPAAEGTYKVKAGDNLTKIAKTMKVDIKELRALNNLKTDRIQVDKVLKLPAKTAAIDALPATTTVTAPPVHTASLH